jgi:type IV pilus assembly protein PilA
MANAHKFHRGLRHFLKCVAAVAAVFFVVSPCHAQTAAATSQTSPWSETLKKYPGLLPEFGKLIEKLQQDVHYPPARTESHLLPLLPETTMSYAAISNFGDVTEQSLKIFRQELQESAVLRDWWEHSGVAEAGPKVLDSLEKIAQLHQFLGDEIVVSGSLQGQDAKLLVIAEIRKPGLKKFLQETITQLGGESKQGIHVFDPQELAAAKDERPWKDLFVLVRPDFVVAAADPATLREFNARLARHGGEFVPTPFGRRIAKEYGAGVTLLAAADLHKLVEQVPPDARQNGSFQRSGFADVKYLVWEHKTAGAQTISQTELSFNTPRHGSASWLAKSGPLQGFDFVSPKAMMAGTILLANPAQIFEDLQELNSGSSSSPFASLPAFEKMLNLSLKDDLLSTLGGEVTFEADRLTPPKPVWKAILSVRDASHLQQTLNTLLAAGHIEAEKFEADGVTYSTVHIPSSTPPLEIDYAFVDGHLILASDRETVADAVRLHKTGESLGKSKTFLAALPEGHSLEASAMLYQDPIAMTALQLRSISPDLAQSLAQSTKSVAPAVVCLYGEDSAIREASGSGAYDFGAVLVVAAVAIPNLLRSRMAANEASAVGSVRTLNTAEITYAATYLERGYAPNLAALGTDPANPAAVSPQHAGFLDQSLANDSCTGDAWCTKSGYHFRVKAICKLHKCDEYVAVATPVDTNTGIRSFCSTSDGVIRYKMDAPLASPVTVSVCKSWPRLQ